MSHNKLSEKSLDLFAAVISVNVNLTDLYFAHNDLDSDSGMKFIANLGNLKRLRRLSLNKCKLNINLLKRLYESISDNEEMTELSLYSNEITTEGAEFIAKIIQNKRHLKTLSLSNNRIGHDGAVHLAQNGLEQLTNLNKLALESNLICNEGLEAISVAL